MKKIIALAVFCLFIFSTATVFAENSVGYVNAEMIIQQSKKLQKLSADFGNFENQIKADFEKEKVGLSDADIQIKAEAFEADLQLRAQMASARIDSSIRTAAKIVAKNSGLDIVITNNTIVYGGKDITQDVIKTIDAGQE